MIFGCAASPGHLVNTAGDAYIVHGDTYRHVWCGDPTGWDHTLADAPEPPFGTPPVPDPADPRLQGQTP